MTLWLRFRDWWVGRFRQQGRLGKLAWVGAPLLFGCCALTMASARLMPGDEAPVREPVLGGTVEREEAATSRPTEVVEPTATELPIRPPATATAGGARLVDPANIPAVTRTPTRAATRTPRPSSTPRPTATEEPPTLTAAPPTATRIPASATPIPPLPTATETPVRVATIALPTATPLPPPPQPTATFAPPPTAAPTSPPAANCDPSYPTVCIPPPPPDLDCGDIPFRRFQVLPPDPHRFDGDNNGIGCESG